MKKLFSEYYPLAPDLIKSLWKNAIFVFDTNILLNLYRYSNETSEQFLKTIENLGNRTWLPHQVALEFHRNRLNVLSEEKKNYQDFEKRLNEIVGLVENKRNNPFLSDQLFNELLSTKCKIKIEIDEKIESFNRSFRHDSLLEKITTAFEGKIGNCFNSDELRQIFSEGGKRYSDKIPPGYCDSKKPEKEKYGDLIIWKQIISKSKEDKMDVILVLDDNKEDWWLEHQGATILPRPELLKEFSDQTNKACHFYKPFQFLEFSNEMLGNQINESIIEEVKNYNNEKKQARSYIQVKLELQGDFNNLNALIKMVTDAGYRVYKEDRINTDLHEIILVIPNIPDLERRLHSKYLSKLQSFNINLINSSTSLIWE